MTSRFRSALLPVAVCLLSACGASEDNRPRVVQLYDQSCISCHERGLANAPKRGDEGWQRLIEEKGMEMLVTHVQEGFRGMPPRGQCFDCSLEDYETLILYMAGNEVEAANTMDGAGQ